MATCNVVNVLCPNGRRQKVKLSPHMTLLQLIQEVCKKQSLNPNNCRIRHQRKILDSSLTIRFANLPNNAHLELIESAEKQIRTANKCIVALQLESGDRLVREFNSDDSLFKILEHWKSQSARISFGDNSDGIVCIYASQEIRGLEKLKSTTLSMIGLNGGRGVIRLIQPSLTRAEKDESDMEGVSEKATSQNDGKAETTTTPSVPTKLSAEEMEVASRCASSVSMASQGSEDDSMQCLDTVLEPMPHSEKSNLPNPSDSETPSRSHRSKKSSKGVKGQDLLSAMDIEQEGSVVEPGGGADKESATSFPGASTSRSAVTVEVFSGVGRTLGGTGPDMKKARFHSPPPPATKNKTNSGPNQDANVPTKDYGNVGVSVARETIAFRLGDGVSKSSDDIADDFFEVTVDDLRLMLKGLKNERTAETQLMTQGMREEREKSKMDQYEKVALRVYFPDQSVLQGFFSPRETVSAVNHFVKDNLQERDTDFYLYTTPPRTLLDKPSITLVEAKLVPTAVIHFGSPKMQECYLKSNIVQQMTSVAEANERVGKHYSGKPSTSSPNDTPAVGIKDNETNGNDKNEKPPATVVETQPTEAVDTRDNVRRNANQAAPKWFKLGK